MRFTEEIKNVRTTKSLADKVQATIQVVRDGKTIEVGYLSEHVVSICWRCSTSCNTSGHCAAIQVGEFVQVNLEDTVECDIVFLSGNYLVPGDVRLLESQNLHIGSAFISLSISYDFTF